MTKITIVTPLVTLTTKMLSIATDWSPMGTKGRMQIVKVSKYYIVASHKYN